MIFRSILCIILALSSCAGFAHDWSAWRELPVFDGGRAMPLATFARHIVADVCGSATPFIAIDDATLDELLAYADEHAQVVIGSTGAQKVRRAVECVEVVARIHELFPRGGRTMQSHEILLSWLVEPEVWHYIPFLNVNDNAVRDELFSLGQRNKSGVALTRVSPYHLTLSESFSQRLESLERSGSVSSHANARSPVDDVVLALNDQYAIFAGVRLDPVRERPDAALALLQRLHSDNGSGSFDRWVRAWQTLSAELSRTSATPVTPRTMETVARTLPQMLVAYDRTSETGQPIAVDFPKLQQQFDETLTAIDAAADEATRIQYAIYANESESGESAWTPKSLTAPQRREHLLAAIELLTSVRLMRREVEAAWLALYDSGRTVRVLPITGGADLLTQRVEQLTPPWLSLTGLVRGDPLFLKRFVDPSCANVQRDWDEVVQTFSAASPDVHRALAKFATSIRSASDKLEPVRSARFGIDASLLRKTAYPAVSLMSLEVRYDDLAPFFWMVVAAAAAIVAVCMSWICGRARRVAWEEAAVWAAILCLAAAAAITVVGGGMRAAITGWAPVTNMYETIILMAWVTTLIGIYFALSPLIAPPLAAAWDATAISTTVFTANKRRRIVTSIVIVARAILSVAVFYAVIRFGFSSVDAATGHTSSPWTELANLWQTLDIIDAATVVLTIAATVWLVPRLLVTVAATPYFISLRGFAASRDKKNRSMLVDRKWFIVIPAMIVVVAGVVAMVRSEFNPSIRPLAAVLRSNFWLTVHVIAIMASYSAALVAWGLSIVSVVAAMTMRYSCSGKNNRPALPAVCANVAPLILQMMRVAVVLLALGIVLGGRWADYSWGRFWGWDPKEVWALITLLYYAIILHGRAMRLYGDFGLAIGGVLGAIPVVTTWYGINYVFRTGMHAYAGGSAHGATLFLYSFIGIHVVLALLAISRYVAEVLATRIGNE